MYKANVDIDPNTKERKMGTLAETFKLRFQFYLFKWSRYVVTSQPYFSFDSFLPDFAFLFLIFVQNMFHPSQNKLKATLFYHIYLQIGSE